MPGNRATSDSTDTARSNEKAKVSQYLATHAGVDEDVSSDGAHAQTLIEQLRAAENDDDLDDEQRERFRERREELEARQ